MAEKILNTRIQLKYDSYANWTKLDVEGKYGNLVLKKGEIGICEIPSGNANATTAPTVLFKVGDGTLPFHHEDPTKCLKWASALAADVHTWAKAATKPEYQASEIKGLDEYIAGEIQDTNTDTQYSFEIVDGKLEVKKTLYTLGVAGTPETVGTYDFVTPEELTTILASYYTKTEVDNLIQGVNNKIDGLDESVTTVAEGTGISVTDTGTGNDHAYTVELDVSGAKTALGLDAEGIAAYVTVESLNATAKGYADGKDGAIQAAHQAGTDAANALDAYKTEMTNTVLPTKADKSVVDAMYTNEQIDEFVAGAKTYADGLITEANLDQYTTEQEVKDIVDGVIKTATSKETLDSLVELVEYIDTHSGDAINMATAIGVLEGKVEVIEQKPAYDITATQISNWDGEVGAKALAEAALPKATAEADYLKKTDAASTYATKAQAIYTGSENITVNDKREVVLKQELTNVNSITNNADDFEITARKGVQITTEGASFTIDDSTVLSADGDVTIQTRNGGNAVGLYNDGTVTISGKVLNISTGDGVTVSNGLTAKDLTVTNKATIKEAEIEVLKVTSDETSMTVGGRTLAAVIANTKVNNAGHADTASSAAHATEADAATNDQFGNNIAATYATKEEAANQAVTALAEAQKYADELAVNYATAAQGAKADSAIQSVTASAGCGIKATTVNNAVTLDWDADVVFVFNCGDSTN